MTANSLPLEGKVVLITGAAQGLGKACARAFATRGAKVALADLNEGLLDETVSELRKNAGECAAIAANIAAPGAPQAVVAKTIDQFGHLDVLINNAAVSS